MPKFEQELAKHTRRIPLLNPFWDFSLEIYHHRSIQTLVLEMQDKFSTNVNVILWAVWLDNTQRYLESDYWSEIEQRINPWLISTTQYRAHRRELKTQITHLIQSNATENQWFQNHETSLAQLQHLRQHVLKLELLSEQYQQALLFLLTNRAKHLSRPNNQSLPNLSTLLNLHWQLPKPYSHKAIQSFEEILSNRKDE